jgi:3-oxoacyl-[acyl-carrier protein] reductase
MKNLIKNYSDNSLKGLNALVTGCNKGIGLEITKKLASHGSNIIACCRQKTVNLIQTFNDLKKKYGVEVEIYEFDLSDQDQIKSSFEKIKVKFDKIDILVNNAASIQTSSFLMAPIKSAKKLFEINYFSQIYLTQLVSKMMIRKKKGNIINISSTSGIDVNEGRMFYSATKAALINSSKILAKELSPFNIRVNVVAPGLIETDMMKQNTKSEIVDNVLKDLTIKRTGKPEEIANIVYFLASDLSSYLNGQVIRVDGGML